MPDHNQDFPFERIRDENGDYFARIADAEAKGYALDQIWSVVVGDSDGEEENTETETWTYGPPHHIVNLMGYIATAERHDHQTYYHETETYKLCSECGNRLYDEPKCLDCTT